MTSIAIISKHPLHVRANPTVGNLTTNPGPSGVVGTDSRYPFSNLKRYFEKLCEIPL